MAQGDEFTDDVRNLATQNSSPRRIHLSGPAIQTIVLVFGVVAAVGAILSQSVETKALIVSNDGAVIEQRKTTNAILLSNRTATSEQRNTTESLVEKIEDILVQQTDLTDKLIKGQENLLQGLLSQDRSQVCLVLESKAPPNAELKDFPVTLEVGQYENILDTNAGALSCGAVNRLSVTADIHNHEIRWEYDADIGGKYQGSASLGTKEFKVIQAENIPKPDTIEYHLSPVMLLNIMFTSVPVAQSGFKVNLAIRDVSESTDWIISPNITPSSIDPNYFSAHPNRDYEIIAWA